MLTLGKTERLIRKNRGRKDIRGIDIALTVTVQATWNRITALTIEN